MKFKTILLAVIFVAVIAVATLLYNEFKGKENPIEIVNDIDISKLSSTADFTVQDADGNDIKLSDMIGKPVVLNFWASWCPPCKEEMPEFEKLFTELGDYVSFMMIDAVDGGRETKETGAAYVAGEGYSFPVYYDTTQEASRKFNLTAIPKTVFIDAEGNLVDEIIGMIGESQLRAGIERIAGTIDKAEYHKLSPEEAKQIMDGGEQYVLLDVRNENEFNEKHIKGALLIPSTEIETRALSELPDKNALILVYCQGGGRSEKAAKLLTEMGYTNICDFGGINNWIYDVVSN